MIKYIKVICFMFISAVSIQSSVIAQEVFGDEIKWGESTKNKFTEMAPEFVGLLSNNLITISTKGSNSLIEEYDPVSLAPISKLELDLKYEKRTLKREKEFIFQNDLVFITSYVNKGKERKYFFIQSYIGEGNLSIPSLIGSIVWKGVPGLIASKKGTVKRETANSALKVDISPNEEHIVVMLPEVALREEGDANRWTSVSYGKELEEEWKYEFAIPNNDIYLDKVKFSNNGKVYCSGIEKVDANTRIYVSNYYRFNSGNFVGDEYYLIVIDGKNDASEIIDLDLGESNILSYSINLLDDEVYFYGLTGTGEETRTSTGVVIRKFDDAGEAMFSKSEEFSTDLFSYNEETDPKSSTGLFSNKKAKIQRNYVLKDIVVNEDGDLMIIAEQFYFYITQSYNHSTGQSTVIYHYVYGDIIVVNCSSKGDLNWMKRIVKYQHTTNDFGYYSSFYSMVNEGDLYLLINDTEYYVNYDELKDSKGSIKRDAKKNNVVSVVKISGEGNIDRDILVDEVEKPFHKMAPKSAVLIDSKLIFVGQEFKSWLAVKTSQAIGQIEVK